MKAFKGNPQNQMVFRAATDRFSLEMANKSYIYRLRQGASAKELMDFLCKSLAANSLRSIGYDELGFPDAVILLTLAILRALPAESRQVWLDTFFASIKVGDDLQEKQVFPKFVKRLLRGRLPKPDRNKPGAEDKVLQQCRRAVNRLIEFVLAQEVPLPERWLALEHELLSAQASARSAYLVKKEKANASPESSEHPVLATLSLALALVAKRREKPQFNPTEILVEICSAAIPVSLQATVLIQLVVFES